MGGSDGACRRRPSSLPWRVRIQHAIVAFAHRRDGSIRRPILSLAGLIKVGTTSCLRPSSEVRSSDITINAPLGIWARVFSPSASAIIVNTRLSVVVYFHGGGFVAFSPSSRPYDVLCRRLCRDLGVVIVSVNYRHAPQHRFPAAYDDGVAVLHFLNNNRLMANLVPAPIDLSYCFLAGDSSGGNMVHHVAQRWASMSETLPPLRLRLAGVVLIQPFFGGEERTEAELALDKACRILSVARADHYWKVFLPDGATRDHPAAHVCGDGFELAETFPPAMVVTGGFDLLKDWHARYVEALRGKGKLVTVVDYPYATHGFYAFPELADSDKFVEDMKLFIDEHRSKRVV